MSVPVISTPLLVGIYLALLCSIALFAASETALFTLRWWRRRALRRDKRLAPLLLALEERPARLLFALLTGSETANILAAMSADTLRGRWLAGAPVWGFVAGVAGAGLCAALLGELLPKLYAASRPEAVARYFSTPLRLWLRAVEPLTGSLADAARDPHAPGADLETLFAHAAAGGSLTPFEARLLTGLDSLGRRTVESVMTPHPDVSGVDAGASLDEALAALKASGFTRLVVIDEAADLWPGYLHATNLLRARLTLRPSDGILSLIREAPLVPSAATIRQGLQALIRARSHLAFVVTETGQYTGLFTLEDGWRAALGESRREAKPLGEGAWSCEGDQPLADLPVKLDTGELDPPPQTLGGLVAGLSGVVPFAGQSVAHDGVKLTVETVRGRRAGRVRLEQVPNEAG
jgi:CBS domain containing-hemolysin-like protein